MGIGKSIASLGKNIVDETKEALEKQRIESERREKIYKKAYREAEVEEIVKKASDDVKKKYKEKDEWGLF